MPASCTLAGSQGHSKLHDYSQPCARGWDFTVAAAQERQCLVMVIGRLQVNSWWTREARAHRRASERHPLRAPSQAASGLRALPALPGGRRFDSLG